MGLLTRLFGGNRVDVDKMLQAIDKSGGQELVKVPIDVFAKYIKEHGEIIELSAGSVKCFLNIDGQKRKVGFQYGVFLGIEEGKTVITVFKKSNISDALQEIGVEAMAESLSEELTRSITSKDMAIALTYQLLYNITGGHGSSYPDDIQKFYLKCSNGLTIFDEGYSDALNKSLHRYDDYHGDFDDAIRGPCGVFNSVISDIYDKEQVLDLCYSTMRKIIIRWNLV